jgi:biotin--protein ligase
VCACRLEVKGPRELAFFPGVARGPVYPGFKYESEAGAHAALIAFLPTAGESEPGGSDLQQPVLAMRSDASGAEPAGIAGSSRRVLATQGDASGICPDLQQPVLASGGGAPGGPPAGGPGHGSAPLCSADGSRSSTADDWALCRDYTNGGPEFVPYSTAGGCSGGITAYLRSAAGSPFAEASSATDSWMFANGNSTPATASSPRSMGPLAENGGTHAAYEVLAVYPEKHSSLAAVRCRVGGGIAVLVGTHPELDPRWLAAQPDIVPAVDAVLKAGAAGQNNGKHLNKAEPLSAVRGTCVDVAASKKCARVRQAQLCAFDSFNPET